MKHEHLLKVTSFMIANFEDDSRLVDIAKSVDCTRSYTDEVKKILVEGGVIVKNDINKRYKLTDKGKLIQENLKDIIRILNEVNKNDGR